MNVAYFRYHGVHDECGNQEERRHEEKIREYLQYQLVICRFFRLRGKAHQCLSNLEEKKNNKKKTHS